VVSVAVTVQTPEPAEFSVIGNATGPAMPRGAMWMWAAVPAISALTMVAFIVRVVGSIITTPVPVAAEFTAGTSSVPVSVAEKTLSGTLLLTEFTWLLLADVGLIGLLSLPQPAITSMDSAAIHHGVKRRE
jgi:hypothetical protein